MRNIPSVYHLPNDIHTYILFVANKQCLNNAERLTLFFNRKECSRPPRKNCNKGCNKNCQHKNSILKNNFIPLEITPRRHMAWVVTWDNLRVGLKYAAGISNGIYSPRTTVLPVVRG